jgi:hypothetical protein
MPHSYTEAVQVDGPGKTSCKAKGPAVAYRALGACYTGKVS